MTMLAHTRGLVGRSAHPRRSLRRAFLTAACVVLATTGCAARMVPSTHGYVLVRTQTDLLVPVPDEDPLYAQFEQQVLSDAFLRHLIDVFEHTTRAYLATDTPNRLRQTVGNYPILVLDSAAPGVLHDIVLQHGEERVSVECALGLGREGVSDLARVRADMAAASAPWLLALVGVSADAGAESLPLDQPATTEAALVAGLAAALDALQLDATAAETAVEELRMARYRAVQANAYATRAGHGQADDARLAHDEASRTPGVAATFLYRLLRQTGVYTPQRYMLWFLSYKAPEMPLAKLLRVCQRMGKSGAVSVETLAVYYADTYPAERQAVLSLYTEVYGEAPDEAHERAAQTIH